MSYELFGTPYSPRMAKSAPNPLLLPEHEQFIYDYMMGNATAYLDEAALELYDAYDVKVSRMTIYRVLDKRGWTRKGVRAFAAQRSDVLRARWRAKSLDWPVDKICCVDESASNEKTGFRKRGWAPVGVECIQLRTLRRSERYSILPALTINGYLGEPFVHHGSITKPIFVWWLLNKVLPLLSPGFIIVMDNCAIHHNLDIDDTLAAADVRIEYLPPYSPDYNPIEASFNTLKKWIQRHWNEVGLFADFADFLEYAARQAVGRDMRAYFKHCHYGD